MNRKLDTEAVARLMQSVLSLKTADEAYKFFEDVCTVNEILTIAQRHEVAYLLRKGCTYLDIAEKTGASTATISRVNRSLSSGGEGYEITFGRIEES